MSKPKIGYIGLEIPIASKGRDIWKKAMDFSGNEASIREMVKYIENKTDTKIEK